jgi:hypothetical protein
MKHLQSIISSRQNTLQELRTRLDQLQLQSQNESENWQIRNLYENPAPLIEVTGGDNTEYRKPSRVNAIGRKASSMVNIITFEVIMLIFISYSYKIGAPTPTRMNLSPSNEPARCGSIRSISSNFKHGSVDMGASRSGSALNQHRSAAGMSDLVRNADNIIIRKASEMRPENMEMGAYRAGSAMSNRKSSLGGHSGFPVDILMDNNFVQPQVQVQVLDEEELMDMEVKLKQKYDHLLQQSRQRIKLKIATERENITRLNDEFQTRFLELTGEIARDKFVNQTLATGQQFVLSKIERIFPFSKAVGRNTVGVQCDIERHPLS